MYTKATISAHARSAQRKERTITAYHEAGHAVVAAAFGMHVKSVDIIRNDDLDRAAFAMCARPFGIAKGAPFYCRCLAALSPSSSIDVAGSLAHSLWITPSAISTPSSTFCEPWAKEILRRRSVRCQTKRCYRS